MKLSLKITQKDFEKAMKLHSKQLRLRTWVFILFILGALFVFTTNFSSTKSIITSLITIILMIPFYWLMGYFLQKFHHRRQYRTNKTYKDELHYTFSDEGLNTIHCLGNNFLKWNCFVRYIENETTYLLYISPYLMHMFPKSSMSEEQKNILDGYFKKYILSKK